MFAAIFIRDARQDPREYATAQSLLEHLTPFKQADQTGAWIGDRALIAQALTWNTPESKHETPPTVCPETGRVIASWVRLDNRDELCAALKLENRETLTDPQIILAAQRLWGAHCTDRLEGDFSFVIYDPDHHEVFCARDSIGAKPFYYVLTDDYFLAVTSVAVLRRMNSLSLSPNLKWTALFAAFTNWAHTEAAYDGVKKLPAAHDMVVGANTCSGPNQYFQFDLSAPHKTHRDPVWVDRYRDAFDSAVKARARSAFLIGAESSAGLDSSSIVASLSKYLPHSHDDLHCFGMAQMTHEPEMLLLVSEKSDVRHTHTLMTPETLRIDETFQRSLTALGHPPEHGQMLFHPSFFEQSESLGIRTLMSGFGGDEVVTNFSRHLIHELWSHREYATVLRELPGTFPARLARFAKMSLQPPPDPFHALQKLINKKLGASGLRQEFIEDTGLREQIETWAFPIDKARTLNELTGLAPGFRFARAGRLESAAIFAATYRVEYRWPLLDRSLIRQFFSTPAIEKRRRGLGRYLHRRAMEGRIPDRILWQRSKFMGDHLRKKLTNRQSTSIAFQDLPNMLQTIIDKRNFELVMNRLTLAANNNQRADNRDEIFVWQVRQLSHWLNDESQL